MVAGRRAAEPGKEARMEEVRVGEPSPDAYKRRVREVPAAGRNSREADFILIERKNFLIQCFPKPFSQNFSSMEG